MATIIRFFKKYYSKINKYLYKHNGCRLIIEALSIVFVAVPVSILYPHVQYFGNWLLTRGYCWQQKLWHLSKHWNESCEGILLMIAVLFFLLAIFFWVQGIGKIKDRDEATERHRELMGKLDKIISNTGSKTKKTKTGKAQDD